MNYEILLEKMMQHFTQGKYVDEAFEAKSYFFQYAGIFDEESPDFELKASQFMDWYLFTRKLKDEDLPPIRVALKNDSYKIEEEVRPFYKNLASNHHSLFEFLKLKGEDVYIRDLFTGTKIVIKKSMITDGFVRDVFFEARIIPHEDNYIFSKSFCFHPPQAAKFILKEIKRVKKLKSEERREAKEDLILRLFKMRYKQEQYQHVGMQEIYTNKSKLKL